MLQHAARVEPGAAWAAAWWLPALADRRVPSVLLHHNELQQTSRNGRRARGARGGAGLGRCAPVYILGAGQRAAHRRSGAQQRAGGLQRVCGAVVSAAARSTALTRSQLLEV